MYSLGHGAIQKVGCGFLALLLLFAEVVDMESVLTVLLGV